MAHNRSTTGPTEGYHHRVNRGGFDSTIDCWSSWRGTYPPIDQRWNQPAMCSGSLGFRVALNVAEKTEPAKKGK